MAAFKNNMDKSASRGGKAAISPWEFSTAYTYNLLVFQYHYDQYYTITYK